MKEKCSSADPFIATRKHHHSELAEDYVEIIYDLISKNEEARICDIAKLLGVSHVTVIRTVNRLKAKGYLKSQKHQPIALTEEGIELAKSCKERHLFLIEYLIALGVPESIATIDVEGMEHHISMETMKAFKNHLKKLRAFT